MADFQSLKLATIASTFLTVLTHAAENFNATYRSSPAAFKIDVYPAFIDETVLKASLTRYATDVEEPDLASGPPRHNVTTVRDYWVNKYKWYDVQAQLNERYLVP